MYYLVDKNPERGFRLAACSYFSNKGIYVLGGDGNRLTEGRWEDGDE